MPVGAGSIKRAAKTTAESEKATGRKTATGKTTAAKTAVEKTTAGKAGQKSVAQKRVTVSKKDSQMQTVYHITEELPFYLL